MWRTFQLSRFFFIGTCAGALFFLAAFLLSNVTGISTAYAQKTLSGEWKADFRSANDEKLQLNFSYQKGKNNSNFGSGYALTDLEGITREQILGVNSRVNFRLVREAGTIECEGVFLNKKGLGTWQFTPNPKFDEGMKSRGYELSDEKLFSSAMLNLTLSFVDDLKSAGFAKLDIEDLFKARIFNVTPQFMAEMNALGFPNLDMEDLVKARIFNIDADFARQVKEMGFAKDSLEELVKLRIFKITPDFLREMKALGFDKLSTEQAVQLQIFKITPAFINEIKAEGLSGLTVEEAVKMKVHKIDAEFIRRAKANGNNDLSVDNLVEMRIFGKVK